MLKKKIRNTTTKIKKKNDAKIRKITQVEIHLSSYLLPHPAGQRFSAPIRKYSNTGPKISIKHNTTWQ